MSSVNRRVPIPAGSGGGLTKLQDWVNRSTETGVQQLFRFDQDSYVNDHIHIDGTQANVVRNATGGIIGDGCLKINVPNTSGSNPGSWRVPLFASYTTDGNGPGATRVYIQFRHRCGPNTLTPSNDGGGWKMTIVGGYKPSSPNSSGSNTTNEIVLNNQNWRGFVSAYRQDGSGFPPLDTTVGSDIFLQSAVDNGSGISDPLQRYCLYQSGSGSAGCWYFVEQQWVTYYMIFRIQSYGGTIGNEFDLYGARDGETTYKHLFHNTDFLIGSGFDGAPVTPLGPNGVWFTPYDTGRTSASYTSWHEYDQLIVSTNPIACPQV